MGNDILLGSQLLGQGGIERADVLNGLDASIKELYLNSSLDTLHHLRKQLPTVANYYSSQLAQTNPAYFKFLNPKQRQALEDKLLFAFYILSLEHKRHTMAQRKAKIAELEANLQHCSLLLSKLRASADPLSPQNQLNAELNESPKYLKFFGYVIVAPYIVQQIMAFVDNKAQSINNAKTGTIIESLSNINEARLFWVWAGGMLTSIFEMLPDSFYNNQQAKDHIGDAAPITGYMSFVLYYTRFAINFLLLLKHTFKGPWMSEEEKSLNLSTWERFKTQWNQRKFALLNDLIWASANMACFFWLKGTGQLGYIGNVVTAGLLVMDLVLTIWRFWEENTVHNKQIQALKQAQAELKAQHERLEKRFSALCKIKQLSDEDALEKQKLLQQLQSLEYKINDNLKLEEEMNFDWKYKRYSHINNIVYAAGLLSSFALMCCCFVPATLIAPALAMTLGLVGAALCFVLTTVYAATNFAIEVSKLTESKRLIEKERERLYQEFKNLLSGDQTKEIKDQQRLIYLQIVGLDADSEYKQRLIAFERIKLAKSILVDALIPAIVFVSLVFIPTAGIGIGVLAAGIALTLLINTLINRMGPKEAKAPEFDDNAFVAFKEEALAPPVIPKKTGISNPFRFLGDWRKAKEQEERDALLAHDPFAQVPV
ncbi:Uncharacterised protein [Legionella beliardensis]|uniref:Coiled-coil protein n=1 Tax=Legionella beliardensis TaxID=91822 RepID=A0A378I634_9GAMM|nr:hypothetical protein [Legionella beliardensis]STX30220.1 Uncharacterised protein [Legionella beliardensis]